MNMEFLSRNYIGTTTNINPNVGTSTIGNLIDRSEDTLFLASVPTTTATTLTVHFTIDEDINRIVLSDCNFKNFSITHSGTTFSLTNFNTSASSWTGNSATSLYLYFSTITVATITLTVNSNTNGDLNHSVGQFWVNELIHQFERNPDFRMYTPARDRREYNNKLADGGWSQAVLDDFFDARIKFEFITDVERIALKSIFDRNNAVVFTPFPTATSWDKRIFEVLWTDDFTLNRLKLNQNDATYRYSGNMRLRESGR